MHDSHYVIIGGTTKAATTSFFNYLSAHPEICPSIFKETRFFLDKNYPLSRPINKGDYDDFYPNWKGEKFKIEATPDYLHSYLTPSKIFNFSSETKLIFILRNPIERFLSWYNFSKQKGLIEDSESLHTFFQKQQNYKFTDQHYQVLEQGKYYQYLERFYNLFPNDNIHIIIYEEIAGNEIGTLKEICGFLGIDETYYDDYIIKKVNVTKGYKSNTVKSIFNKYENLKYSIRSYTSHRNFHKYLGYFNSIIISIYELINAKKLTNKEDITFLQSKLRGFYENDQIKLEELINKKTNW